MSHPTVPSRVPAGATPEGDGVVIGDGPVRVDAFIDFLCPFCRQFELASTTNYSTRAAAASGCAADQGRFAEYAHALFVAQPPEGGPGLSDAELAEVGRAAGLTDPAFAACLAEGPYLDWPPYVTERATAAGVTGTPTVLVAGAVVQPEPEAITAAVAQA